MGVRVAWTACCMPVQEWFKHARLALLPTVATEAHEPPFGARQAGWRQAGGGRGLKSSAAAFRTLHVSSRCATSISQLGLVQGAASSRYLDSPAAHPLASAPELAPWRPPVRAEGCSCLPRHKRVRLTCSRHLPSPERRRRPRSTTAPVPAATPAGHAPCGSPAAAAAVKAMAAVAAGPPGSRRRRWRRSSTWPATRRCK